MSNANPMGLNRATDAELLELVVDANELMQEIAPHFATAETKLEVQILSDFYTTVYLHKLAATSSLTVRSAS